MKTNFLKNYRAELALLQKPLQEPPKNPANASVQNTLKTPDVFDSAQIQSKKNLLETLKPAAPLPDSKPVKKKKKSFWQKLRDAFKKVGNAFKKAFNTVGNFFKKMGDSIGQFFKNIWNSVAGFFKDVGEFFKEFKQAIKFLAGAPKLIPEMLAQLERIVDKIANPLNAIKNWLENPNLSAEGLKEFASALEQLVTSLKELEGFMDDLRKAGIPIPENILGSTLTMQNWLGKGMENPLTILENKEQFQADLAQFNQLQKQFQESFKQA